MSYVSYVNYMIYVNCMSYVGRLYEFCELCKLIIYLYDFCFQKNWFFLLIYKDGKAKL